MELIKPPALMPGDTIGVFTPSSPGHLWNTEKYELALGNLRALGFEVIEGSLTASKRSEGYRTAPPQDRAAELMELFVNPKVHAVMATIGGSNSASLIPFLDFDVIRANPKILSGYSDITSLNLALLAYSGLQTFYGPAVLPSFGEWPEPLAETRESFLQAVTDWKTAPRELRPPARWSNHWREWSTDEWKTEPRKFEPNPGWKVLQSGCASAPILLANLSTLMSAAGTDYFPDCGGKILLIESMDAPFSKEERHLRQLERLGVYDEIAGLIIGKPERPDSQKAPFTHDDLVLEIVGSERPYPIVSNFDCCHTHPMLTIAEHVMITLEAREGYDVIVRVEEPMVAPPR